MGLKPPRNRHECVLIWGRFREWHDEGWCVHCPDCNLKIGTFTTTRMRDAVGFVHERSGGWWRFDF